MSAGGSAAAMMLSILLLFCCCTSVSTAAAIAPSYPQVSAASCSQVASQPIESTPAAAILH